MNFLLPKLGLGRVEKPFFSPVTTMRQHWQNSRVFLHEAPRGDTVDEIFPILSYMVVHKFITHNGVSGIDWPKPKGLDQTECSLSISRSRKF
jgi:hypothetical protein